MSDSPERTIGRTIGWAVKQLHNASRVRRAGWNGKGMWLALVKGSQWDLSSGMEPDLSNQGPQGEGGYAYRHPFIAMRAHDGALVPWMCSQADILATDWEVAS